MREAVPDWAREIYAERMAGFEERPVGKGGRTVRMVPVASGEHHESCVETGDGWVCQGDLCTIEDGDSLINIAAVTVDRLIEVRREVERPVLYRRCRWSMTRVSRQTKFSNGRCVVPRDESISETVWYEGVAWTRWGSRRKMAKIAPVPSI